MVLTFYELRQQVLTKLDEIGATTTTANVNIALNNANVRRSNQHPWSWMMTLPTTVATIPGVREVSLKHNLQSLGPVRNITGNIELKEINQRHFAELQPVVADLSGSARRFVKWGQSPVKHQPTETTALRIVSDSALDTGADYNFVIKGEDADGNERADVITPAGLTPQGGTVAFTRILGYSKRGDWNGNLTLSNAAGTETYLTLMPWEMGKQYQQLYLIEIPTVAETLSYRGRLQPLWMVNDYDQPNIPGGDAVILVYDALIEMAPYIKDITPQDITVWSQFALAHERNLYLQEMGEGFNTEGEAIHLVDDGWEDTF